MINIGIRVDFTQFHGEIIRAIRKNMLYAFKTINEKIIIELVNPVLSFLLFITKNVDCRSSLSDRRELYAYFQHDDAIQVFDDLTLAFNAFLRDMGIAREKQYTVIRYDTGRTLFLEHGDANKPEVLYA